MNKLLLVLLFSFCFPLFAAEKAVVLPERFKEKPILVVNSPEYKSLLEKNQKLVEQLKIEKQNLDYFSKEIDKQKEKNLEVQDKMVRDIQSAQITISKQSATIAKKELALWGHRAVILLLTLLVLALTIGRTYLKSQFPFLAPFI